MGLTVPFGTGRPPAYVLERQLMIAALDGERVVRAAGVFVQSLWRSHTPTVHKAALTGWAIAQVPPVPSWRRTLIDRRRSPSNRSRAMRLAVRVLRGRRKP
jgi:hypothetical protein